MTGRGMNRQIRRARRARLALSPGDTINLMGYSRGAFAVRFFLAGLIRPPLAC